MHAIVFNIIDYSFLIIQISLHWMELEHEKKVIGGLPTFFSSLFTLGSKSFPRAKFITVWQYAIK